MGKLLKYKIYCQTDEKWEYIWKEEGQTAPDKCPTDTSHVVDLDSVNIDEVRDDGNVKVQSVPPFAAKVTPDGKKLFKRVVGLQQALIAGDTEIVWPCSFPWVKFMGIEIIGAESLDKVNLYVLDDDSGSISGVPNTPLNQFGFSANIAKDFYSHKSEFDADLQQGLKVKIVYSSVSDKTVGINFVMNEVKP